jgi:hypothetical protein
VVESTRRTTTVPERVIHLPEEAWSALERSASANRKSIDQVVEESLEATGVLPSPRVTAMLREARARSGLSEEQALELAVAETRAARRQRRS